jgi:xanthine dehydrogenase YagS FAD-binding subunit
MNVALAALRAEVVLQGANGERRLPFADFHRLPGDTPERDTNLEPGELIVAVDLPASPFAAHSHYLKVRDRASYAFALVSVAAALDLQGGLVRDAALALGGVAPRPWRLALAEAALIGRPLDAAAIAAASERLLAGARPLNDNAFKVELARRSIARALQTAGGLA